MNYADATYISLPDENLAASRKNLGWSSGHRVDHPDAEGWATASVFSYAQALRRLVGEWTREEAVKGLNRITTHSKAKANKEIGNRGDTWSFSGELPVSDQLVTLFVNPARRAETSTTLEPDTKPIQSEQARSAILFGPPGTSKTSLARSVAGALGWQYVELHASHFVAAGLPAVQSTADEIFQRLMELDHTVVLFDEIDELVRERDVEPDAFGRFLTTSMLPKLAELWKQRKLIYFIATNHIEYFDKAVTRAQRFDALIFVTPPSFEKKTGELRRLLSKTYPQTRITIEFTEVEVVQALAGLECLGYYRDDDSLPEQHVLAKFVLLRWDQLDELAYRISRIIGQASGGLKLSRPLIEEALKNISDPSLLVRKTYCDYQRAGRYSMKDFSKETVWAVENLSARKSYFSPLAVANQKVWLTCSGSPEEIVTSNLSFAKTSVGCVFAKTIKPTKKKIRP